MKRYKIGIHGCDDTTYVEMTLNDEQIHLIEVLCKKSEENSTYQCMPTMEVEKVNNNKTEGDR